jgi:hypothetical protein
MWRVPVRRQLTRGEKLLYVSYLFTSLAACTVYVGVFAYAYSHDPYLTPRWTDYMIVWSQAGGTLFSLFLVLVPAGLGILYWSPDLRRRYGIWCAVMAIIGVIFFCGVP